MKGQNVRRSSQGAVVDSPNGVVTPPDRPEPAAAPRAPSAWTSWRLTVLAAALIVLAALAAYHNSFAGVFAYDDEDSIVRNVTIRQLWPIWPLLNPPHNGETVGGRPLLNLSLAINYAISGLNLWTYHAANLLIHMAAALVLFGVLRRTFLAEPLRKRFGRAATPLALGSTLLWTVHPLQTESVTYIVQRAESLAGLFYLLTLYCVIRGASGSAGVPPAQADAGETPALRPWLWYATAVLACLLGMATKEVTVTAPLIVLLYDRTFLAGSFAAACRQRWGLYVGLAVTWGLLIFLVLSTGLIFRQSEIGAPDAWSYARSQPGVILHYLRLCVWPQSLCTMYAAWPLAYAVGEILPGALVIGTLLAATISSLIRNKAEGFLGAWFFLILAPTSSVLALNQLAHEHRMYLPLAAVVVLGVVIGYACWDSLLVRWVGSKQGASAAHWALPLAALTTVVLLLGFVTFSRNSDYQSPVLSWKDLVRRHPDSAPAHYALAVALAKAGNTDEALHEYRVALRAGPAEADVHFNLGVALVKLGHVDDASEHFREAVRLKPNYFDARNNLGMLLAAAGRIEEALKHFREAARLRPDSPDAHYNLGLALAGLGRTQEAIEQYQQAVRLKPEDATAHNNLALALAAVGRGDEAIKHYQEALRLQPEDAAFHNNLAITLAAAQRTDEALKHYQQALRLKPDLVAARYNLASLLEGLGRTKEAIDHYSVLFEQRPDSAEILRKLAWLLATAEDVESEDAVQAVQLAQRARELGGQENAQCLDTLAAAYAAAGRFDDAVIVAERAIALAEAAGQTALAKNIQSRLELYRAGRPYREAPSSPGPTRP